MGFRSLREWHKDVEGDLEQRQEGPWRRDFSPFFGWSMLILCAGIASPWFAHGGGALYWLAVVLIWLAGCGMAAAVLALYVPGAPLGERALGESDG